jgi:flagellar biosynthesis component FlhA
LQALLREEVPVTDLEAILREFERHAPHTGEAWQEAEAVRLVLSRSLPGNDATYELLRLSSAIEDDLQPHCYNGKTALSLEPEKVRRILAAVRFARGTLMPSRCAIVTGRPGLRPFFRRVTEFESPPVPVLALSEVRPELVHHLKRTIDY